VSGQRSDPPVGVAVDVVVLTLRTQPETEDASRSEPLVLTVRRDRDPFAGHLALPGGRVRGDEDLESAARRVLAAAGRAGSRDGLGSPRHLEQLATFGDPGRDPRGRVVSVSYLALLPEPVSVAPHAAWQTASDPPELAFDHATILASAVDRLRAKLSYSTVAYGLLPDSFTLSEVQAVYQAVLARTLDKRNFRRKLLSLGVLQETGTLRRGSHRPAQLYRFSQTGLVLLDEVITA